MTHKYYLSTFMKAMLILTAFMVLVFTAFQLLLGKYISLEIPGQEIMFTIFDLIIIVIIIWRIKTPLVEISETGIKVGIPFLFKTNTAKWDEIQSMTINEMNTLGIKENTVKLLLKAEQASTEEIIFSLKAVEKADEIIKRLRGKIPNKGYEDIKQSAVLQKPVTLKEIRYRLTRLSERGITKAKETIPWESVTEVKYQGFVIAGYGSTTIAYQAGGRNRSMTIAPSLNETYQECIRYIITHAQKASIDPALLKALEYPPEDARADMLSIVLLITGIALFFVCPLSIAQYSPTIFSSNIYPFLAITLAGIPLAISIKLFVGRFRGKNIPAKKKLIWTSLINAGAILSVPVFFILSPFSFYWVMGDIYKNTDSFDKAEHYYSKALLKIPDSIDILYEMGKLCRKQEQWDKAADYLQRAYVKDPSYWGPMAVELIPDTYMKMGKHDIALQWCERILKDHPNKIDIARTISRKQDEIISERGIYKRTASE